MCKNYRQLDFVIDDESYFTLDHSTINGSDFFYTSNIGETPAHIKYRQKPKFYTKLLVWACFSKKGFANFYFVPSGLAINQFIYLEECIIKRLIPFIRQHHSDDKYIFWPDKASSHYANIVIDHLKTENINYVPKLENPSNLPEARPIEQFWSILKGHVYKNNWKAENLEKLKERIKYCINKIDLILIQKLCEGVYRRLDGFRRNGLPEEN
jgi:transposase